MYDYRVCTRTLNNESVALINNVYSEDFALGFEAARGVQELRGWSAQRFDYSGVLPLWDSRILGL